MNRGVVAIGAADVLTGVVNRPLGAIDPKVPFTTDRNVAQCVQFTQFWQPDASWLFPPSPRDWLPEDYLVYSLLNVTEQIDISAILRAMKSPDGLTDQANDVRQTTPMVDQTVENLNAAGVGENIEAFTADAGYFSEENMQAVDSNDRIDDAFIATGRQNHNDPAPDSPKRRRNRTKKGKAEYARRKVIIEPVFGQIKECLGFRKFLLRGLEKMKGEWNLVCIVHNLLKLFRSGALAAS